MRTEYKVVYKRKGRGWTARVRGLRRCRASAPTIREAREALREALARCVANPQGADFLEDVELPRNGRRALVQHWRARRAADAAEQRARHATAEAVAALLALKVNLKDAADLLGVSMVKARALMEGLPAR